MHPVADLTPQAAPLVIIGCGNLNRSDDGVGVRVIHELHARWHSAPPPGIKLFDAGTAGLEVMFHARGAGALIIVDASRSGSAPGAVFELPGEEVDGAHDPGYSLHDFRWDHAVHAGRRIFGSAFPSHLTVYLVEAESLVLGTELSASVEPAVGKVCDFIEERVSRWLAHACA